MAVSAIGEASDAHVQAWLWREQHPKPAMDGKVPEASAGFLADRSGDRAPAEGIMSRAPGWDSCTGLELPDAAVRASRAQEMCFMAELGVWEIVGRDVAA